MWRKGDALRKLKEPHGLGKLKEGGYHDNTQGKWMPQTNSKKWNALKKLKGDAKKTTKGKRDVLNKVKEGRFPNNNQGNGMT